MVNGIWRHPLDAIADRQRSHAVLAIGGAWLALMTGLLLGGLNGARSIAAAGAIGAVLVFLGFAAASTCRTQSRVTAGTRRLVFLSLGVGAALGVANLIANWAIAAAHPALRALLVQRFAALDPLQAVISAPLVEEVTVRLFLMSVMAWILFRLTKRCPVAFAVALVGSALFFAALHLFRPLPLDPALANAYRAALLVKYTLAGVPLGWIFWRWGLPYAILCHAVVNAVHIALEEFVFY